MFIDEADIYAEGGRGGDGSASFRREKYRPHGGPDGGSGGAGGAVVIEASGSRGTLSEFHRKRHFRAAPGRRGGPQDRAGRAGEDLVIHVPCGTVVSREGMVVADLVEPGQRVTAARGGRGGRGNAALVSEAGPLPRFAELGEPGESPDLHLELKLVADVALVGLPNAGKSTLISRISMARPRIADYPFTTTEPNLGVVQGEEIDFVVTDVPGLIEGAHLGKGMGIDFLRHIERASIIVYLVDMSPDTGREPYLQLVTLESELGLFSAELLERTRVVAANKMDLAPAEEALEALRAECMERGLDLFEVSAVTGAGVAPLLHSLESRVRAEPAAPRVQGPPVTYTAPPEDGAISARREGGRFVVEGRGVERIVLMIDLNSEEARSYLAARLRRAGVEKLLEREGAEAGDEVEIAGKVFEYVPEAGTAAGGRRGDGTRGGARKDRA